MATKTQKLKTLVLQSLEDNKANSTLVLDVAKFANFTECMIITTGTSTRQVRALAQHIVEDLKKNKLSIIGVEAEQDSTWTLIDAGDVIIHIMTPETREFYSLEKLWGLETIPKTKSVKTKTKAIRKIKGRDVLPKRLSKARGTKKSKSI